MAGIVWLASYPKSGNTWVRAFLANLILDRRDPLPLDEIGSICPGEANVVWFRPLTDRPVDELSKEEIAALRPRAQMRAVKINQHNVLMKTHNCIGEHFSHPMISVDATAAAIYIVRDPRDVALSATDHFGLSVDETIEFMNRAEAHGNPAPGMVYEVLSSWSIHVKSWTQRPLGNLHVVRYEDLLADPSREFRTIAKKLGITRDKARIRRAVKRASFKKLQAIERDLGFAERSEFSEKFFRSGKAGAWKDKLTPAQAKRIERDHGEQMERFGYL